MALTYEPIATYTHTGASTTNLTLSSIPATYTDLVLVGNIIYSANGGNYISLRFNDDTNTNYSSTPIVGNGTTASSTRATNDNKIAAYASSTTQYVPYIVNIMNYTNTTTNKTVLMKISNAGSQVEARVGLWRKTPEAINRVDIYFALSSIAAGSIITLYGIKAA